jgi:hypothetical protein
MRIQWRGVRATLAAVLLMSAWTIGAAQPARAMQAAPDESASAEADASQDPSATGEASASEVRIEIEQFGLANVPRLGDWIGVRVRIQDVGTSQRTVLVRLSTLDADGDQPQQQREVTSNPGVWQGAWLYMRLPFAGLNSVPVRITVHEAVETGAAAVTSEQGGTVGATAASERVYRAGRLLGRLDVPANRVNPQPENVGLMGVLGDRDLGLRQYSDRPDTPNSPYSRLLHELTQVATGLKPATMPDRWMGLASFDTLLWGSGEVTELREERARALREWVQRGAHLIIVLPPVGQQWMNPASNDLYTIMPAVTVNRRENADMLPYRPMITSRIDARYPARGVVHTFTPNPAAVPGDAMPILNGPDGECVVVRRLVGAGAVTMIGFDLNTTLLSQTATIEADVFWHRVLGRRGELLPERMPTVQGLSADRRPWYVDGQIASEIAITGRSAIGALVAFVVFGLYWVIVGPVAFYVLRGRDLHKHSWMAFLAGSAAFTLLAWGLATFLRPQRVEATHLTILDHVYGQNVQRARMWTSLLIPSYGEARVTIGDASGEAPQSLSAVAPWEAPGDDAARVGSFPDARGYAIDTRTPDAMIVPVRATVKTLQADWAGAPVWRMPTPVGADGAPGELTLTRNWNSSSGLPLLNGSLVHDLPEPLRRVKIQVVVSQTPITGTGPATFPLVSVLEYGIREEWKPNEPFDLGVESKRVAPTALIRRLDAIMPNTALLDAGGAANLRSSSSLENELDALTFFHLLPPPDFNSGSINLSGVLAAQRRATHGLDLSRWATQPCVIVTGYIGDESRRSESPVPLFVDAEPVKTRGRTLVRWVYPLPPNPPGVIDVKEQRGRPRPKSQTDPLSPSGEEDTAQPNGN